MTRSAITLTCSTCGAVVPLEATGVATCIYCLTEVELPPDLQAPLARHSRLGGELERASRQLEQKRGLLQAQPRSLLALGLCLLLFSLPMVLPLFMGRFSIGGLAMAIFSLALPIGLLRASRDRQGVAALAALPMAQVTLEPGAGDLARGLILFCPMCGGGLAAGGEGVTVRCGHCDAEALLPAALVVQHHQRRVRAIMQAKQQGQVADQQRRAGQRTSNRTGATMLILLGALLLGGAAITVGLILSSGLTLAQAARYTGLDLDKGVMTAAVIGGLLLVMGLATRIFWRKGSARARRYQRYISRRLSE